MLRKQFLLTLLTLPFIQFTAFSQCSDFSDDFESGNYSPTWSVGAGITTPAVTTTNPALGSYRLEGTGGTSTHLTGFSTSIASSTPSEMSWWINTGSNNTSSVSYFVCGDNAVSATNCIAFVYFSGSSGNIRFVSGFSFDYPATQSTWYHIELKNIDWGNHNFDIYINGSLYQTAFPFRSATQNSVSTIHLYNYNSGLGIWDDVRIGGNPISLSASVTDVDCFGNSSGNIDLTATSTNAGSLSYAWSNGNTNEDATALIAGTYSVTVTDPLGCQKTLSGLQVTEPSMLTTSIVTQNVLCSYSVDGQIVVTANGGTPNYTYLWSGGETTDTLYGGAGAYSCTTTDDNGCTVTDTVTITSPPEIITTFSISEPSCWDTQDGIVVAEVTGGMGNYSYSWQSGDTTILLSGLGSGVYSVIVTDDNNCTDTQSVTVTPPLPLDIQLSAMAPSTCNGSEGSIDAVINGGTPGYSFSWSNGATTEDISGLVQGDYTLDLTDTNGCTTQAMISLIDPQPTAVSLDIPEDTVCVYNSAFTLTGASLPGGMYTGTGVSGGSFDPSVAGLGVQTIVYTYTDTNNCVSTDSDTLTVDACLELEQQTLIQPLVYPNPATAIVYVDQLLASGYSHLQLLNELGAVVFSCPVTTNSLSISAADYAPGVYLLHFSGDRGNNLQKIVLK